MQIIYSKIDMGAYEFLGNHTYLEPVRIVKRDRFCSESFNIEVASRESYLDIRYTTDGSNPDETSDLYSPQLPLMIANDTKLKVKGYKSGFTPTPIDSVEYLFGFELKDSLSGTLDKGGLPYFVTSDIFVAADDTLYMGEGVKLKFLDNYQFIIEGRIFADGQPFMPVSFTSYDTTAFHDSSSTAGGWGGITIKNNMNDNKFYGCVFEYVKKSENGNYTSGEDGGVFNISDSKVTITSSILINNYAKNGSSIFADNSEVFFANNLVKNSRSGGSAALNINNSKFSFINNTVVANKANKAAAISLTDCSEPDILNNIFWDNVSQENDKQIVLNSTTNADIAYNTLELGIETISVSLNSSVNYSENHQFYPDFNEQTYSGYEIQSYSPCINAGIPDTSGLHIPAVDLSGRDRIYDGEIDRIDIGAYEFNGEPDGSPIISFKPSSINFEFVEAGTTVFDTLRIVNNGNKAMNITDIEFLNNGETIFEVAKFGKNSSFEFTIESHSTDSILVKMTPIADIDSSYSSKLKIASIELTSPLYLNISGRGITGTFIDDNTVSGIWSKENNPYNVIRDIEVDTDLVINEGVEVKFYSYSSLTVGNNDKITVNGTKDEKVLFTATDTSGFDLKPNTLEGGWKGLYLTDSGDDDLFNNCIVEYVKKIRFNRTPGIAEDSTFLAEETGAFYLRKSSPLIKNSEIIKNRAYGSAGVYGKNGCRPYLENVEISRNTATLFAFKYKEVFAPKTTYYRSGSLFFVNGSNPTIKNVAVINNYLEVGEHGCNNMSGQTALTLNSSTATVINSTFVSSNAEYGVLRLNKSSSPTIINSIIWNEENSISTTLDDDDCDPNIFDSDFVNSLSGILYYDSLKYVSNTEKNVYTGTFKNNMNFDPEFTKTDPLFGYIPDYTDPYELRRNSPCINAGRIDLSDFDLPEKDLLGNDRIYDSYRIDLGAYEYQGEAGGSAIVNLAPTSIDFKYCSSGGVKRDTLVIHNYGNSGLNIQNFEFEKSEGEFGVEFFEGNSELSYLAEHSKDSIIVVFKPVNSDILDYSDKLFIVTDIGTKPLPVAGTGVDGTLIEGGFVSGDWEKSGQPYHVVGDIEVDNSLSVHEGVNVIFHGFYGLTVSENDKFEVIGTEFEKVRFTASDSLGFEGDLRECADGWSGIRFKDSGSDDILNFAVFEYGNRYLQKDEVDEDSTKVYGGAVYANNSSPVIKNSHFRKNIANKGGAIYFDTSSSAKVENCTFKENYSFMVTVVVSHNVAGFSYAETFTYPGYGGAINSHNSDLIITNSSFYKNESEYGGAVFSENSILEQYNSIYSENRSSRTGGAIRIVETQALFSNLTVAWNRSASGGGISIYRSSPVIINSIIRDNVTETTGSEIFVSDGDNDNIYSFPNIQYNNIEGGLEGIGTDKYKNYDGVYYANMDFDPNFAASGTDPLAIKENSSCINAGTSSLVELLNLPSIDIVGNSRIYDGTIDRLDIGAYEYQGESSGTPLLDTDVTDIDFWYQPAGKDTTITLKIFNHGNVLLTVSDLLFDEGANSNYSFSTFDKKTKGGKSKRDITFRSVKLKQSVKGKDNIFDIQSHSSDSVKVTFTSDLGKNIRYEDKLAVISNGQENKFVNLEGYGLLGTVIYGGEVGDAVWTKEKSPYDIIGDLEITGSLTIEAGTEVIIYDYESITVVESGKLLIQGSENDLVTFASGDPDQYFDINTQDGGWGGIRFINSGNDDRISYASFKHGKKLVNDHWFSGTANKNGGALYFENSSVEVRNSIFEYNSAENGGAISFVNPEKSSSVVNCEFRSNNGVNGGAVYSFNSNGKLIQSLLENNRSSGKGGALYCEGEEDNAAGEFKIIGNQFLSNSSVGDGGGLYLYYSSPRLESNIIARNTAAMGGGVYIHFSSPTVINCTIASNSANLVGGGVYVYKTSKPHFYNSIIYHNSAPFYLYGEKVLDPPFKLEVDPNKQVISHSFVTPMLSFLSKPKFDYTNLQGEDRNIIHFTEMVTPSGTTYHRGPFDERYYNNVECNPEFNNDFSLRTTSPCIDLGMEDLSSLVLEDYDVFNNSRIKANTIIDLGAAEFQDTNTPKPVLTHRVDEVDFGNLYAERDSTLILHYYNSGNKVLNVTDQFLENDSIIFTLSKVSPLYDKLLRNKKVSRNSKGENILLEIPIHGKDSLFVTFSPADSTDQYYFDNVISKSENTANKYLPLKGHGVVKPDLAVTEISPPATANSGEMVTVSWIVKNRGVYGTNVSGWQDKLFLTMAVDSLDFMDEVEGAVDLGSFDNTSYLMPGESYRSTAEITLPEGLQGIFRIGVKTDFKADEFFEGLVFDKTKGVVDERDEDNNISISRDSIALNLTLPPDLQVEYLEIPSFARSGSEIDIVYRVVNAGDNPTGENSSWKDKIYFSKDSLFNNNAVLLRTHTRDGQLLNGANGTNADSSYTVSTSIRLPHKAQGNHSATIGNDLLTELGDCFIYVVTDAENNIEEHIYEGNNRNLRSLRLNIIPPDYEAKELVVTDTVFSGGEIEVTWNVRNNGPGINNDYYEKFWKDRIYISSDEVLNIDTTMIKDVILTTHYLSDENLVYVNDDGKGELDSTYQVSKRLKIPDGYEGEYYIFNETDADNDIFEYDEIHELLYNNVSAPTPVFVKLSPYPDLEVNSISAPDTLTAGDKVEISWAVLNNDSVLTDAAFKDKIYISTLPSFEIENSTLLKSVLISVDTLKTLGTYSKTAEIMIPITVSGRKYIHIVTDADNDIFEHEKENNNVLAKKAFVNQYPSIDLLVEKEEFILQDSIVWSGSKVNVSWNVKNIGEGITRYLRWYDELYLSTDSILDDEDIHLTNHLHIGKLDIGQTYHNNDITWLPNGVEGDYYIILKVGRELIADDSNPQNNTVFKPVTIQLTPYPDSEITSLIVSKLYGSKDNKKITKSEIKSKDDLIEVTAGQPAKINWIVTNSGTAPTGNEEW